MIKVNDTKNFDFKIKMIGTGDSFSSGIKTHSMGYMKFDDTLIVIDAGNAVIDFIKHEFEEKEYSRVIFCITHMHPDHSMGLTDVIFWLLFNTKAKSVVYSLPEVITDIDTIFAINGMYELQKSGIENLLERVIITHDNTNFGDDIEIGSTEPSLIINTFIQDHHVMPACGFRFAYNHDNMMDIVAYSGDTKDGEGVLNMLVLPDIFRLTYKINFIQILHEVTVYETSDLHTTAHRLLAMIDELKDEDVYCPVEVYHLPEKIRDMNDLTNTIENAEVKARWIKAVEAGDIIYKTTIFEDKREDELNDL